jgi:cytochrome c oxidase subunit 3
MILEIAGGRPGMKEEGTIESTDKEGLLGTIFTVFLAMIFTAFQGVEYAVSSFTISDGAYGSCFHFGTGFHAIHVIIGTILWADKEGAIE